MKFEKKVRVLKDCDFKNGFTSKYLIEGEITIITFKNQEELDTHLKIGSFELVGEDVEERKEIPVLFKKDSSVPAENELLATLELTGNLDKLKNEN